MISDGCRQAEANAANAAVEVNEETGTIVWPNSADIDPDFLYTLVSGEPVPDFEPACSKAE